MSTTANVERLAGDSVRVLTGGSSSYEIEGEIWIQSEGADAAPGPDEGEAANPAEEGGARRDQEGEDTLPVNSTSELPGIIGTSVDTFEDGVKSNVKLPGEVVVLDNATSEDARLSLPGSIAADIIGDPGSSTLPWTTRMATREATRTAHRVSTAQLVPELPLKRQVSSNMVVGIILQVRRHSIRA